MTFWGIMRLAMFSFTGKYKRFLRARTLFGSICQNKFVVCSRCAFYFPVSLAARNSSGSRFRITFYPFSPIHVLLCYSYTARFHFISSCQASHFLETYATRQEAEWESKTVKDITMSQGKPRGRMHSFNLNKLSFIFEET